MQITLTDLMLIIILIMLLILIGYNIYVRQYITENMTSPLISHSSESIHQYTLVPQSTTLPQTDPINQNTINTIVNPALQSIPSSRPADYDTLSPPLIQPQTTMLLNLIKQKQILLSKQKEIRQADPEYNDIQQKIYGIDQQILLETK